MATTYFGGSSFNGMNNTYPQPICFINCTNEAGTDIIYSFHPGAGGVVMCDGSAHMLSENVSVVVFCDMISFKGHEPVTGSALQ